jgi:hypothetical protein
LPDINAGWVVRGAADPTVSRKDDGRNICAYGIGDIAAAKTAAAADGISRAAAIAIVIVIATAGIVNPAVETEAAIITVAVTAKETTGATTAAVESGDAAAVKHASTVKTAAAKSPAVKTAAAHMRFAAAPAVG